LVVVAGLVVVRFASGWLLSSLNCYLSVASSWLISWALYGPYQGSEGNMIFDDDIPIESILEI